MGATVITNHDLCIGDETLQVAFASHPSNTLGDQEISVGKTAANLVNEGLTKAAEEFLGDRKLSDLSDSETAALKGALEQAYVETLQGMRESLESRATPLKNQEHALDRLDTSEIRNVNPNPESPEACEVIISRAPLPGLNT